MSEHEQTAEEAEVARDRTSGQVDDLQRRIDRTLAYIAELEPQLLSSDARIVVDAVRRSLSTPSGEEADR